MQQRGWSNVELSQKSGVSYRRVYDIMKGKAKLRDQTIQALAKAMGITPSDLGRKDLADSPPPRSPPMSEPPPDMMRVPHERLHERRAEYSAGVMAAPAIPLHEIITLLARQIGCPETDVLEFVMKKMREKKP
jgi:transcriptional regulator with XRE-family HTH domain